MSIKILCDNDNLACLYDSVTEIPFGYLIHSDIIRSNRTAQEIAEDFLTWSGFYHSQEILRENFGNLYAQYLCDYKDHEWPIKPESPESWEDY